MENTQLFKQELFEKLKFATVFENFSPLSTQGINLQNRVVSALKNDSNTFSLRFAGSILDETARVANFDAAAKEISEGFGKIVESVVFKYNIALLSETLEAGLSKDQVQEMLVKECEALLTESEETVLANIQNGRLAVYEGTSKAVKAIVSQAKSRIVLNESAETKVNDVKVYSPVSYVEIHEDAAFMRVAHHIFAVSDAGIKQAAAPSRAFLELTNLVEKLNFVEASDGFVIENSNLGKIELTDGKIFKQDETGVFEELSISNFAKNASVVASVKANGNKLDKTVARNIMESADGVIAVANNYKNIYKLDNFIVIENARVNEAMLLCTHKNRIFAGVLESSRKPKEFLSFARISEALNYVKENSGVDLSTRFEEELVLENSANAEKTIQITKQNNLLGTLTDKLGNVNEELQLVEAGSPAHESLLKLQGQVKGIMVEENNKLKTIIAQ